MPTPTPVLPSLSPADSKARRLTLRAPKTPAALAPNRPSTSAQRPRSPVMDRFLPAPIARHVLAFVSEFAGTTFYLFFAMAGAQIAFDPPTSSPPASFTAGAGAGLEGPLALLPGLTSQFQRALDAPSPVVASLCASLAAGFSLAVSAWVFWRVTGGLFNPAVAVGMVVQGSLGWVRGVVVVGAEVLGGVAAAGLVRGVVPGDGGEGGVTGETGGGMEALLRGGMGVARGFCESSFLPFAAMPLLFLAVFQVVNAKADGSEWWIGVGHCFR